MKRVSAVFGVLLLFAVFTQQVHATNGMNMISYGGQEAGMGGASLGISDNAFATNNNPAGLWQIRNQELDFGLSVLFPSLKHKDDLNHNYEGEQGVFPLPMASYARKLSGTPVVLGMGLFAQGGMGADFKDLNTIFGTRDELYSNVGYLKFAPSLSYELNDRLAVGLALNAGYAFMGMKFFPNTFAPPMPGLPMGFAGFELKDVNSFGYGAKIGLQWKPLDIMTVGLVYTTKSQLDFDNGRITFASGSGMGTYDAKVDGFNWPQSFGIGVGLRPLPKLLVGIDMSWVNWEEALKTVTIKFNTPGGEQSLPFVMNWKDQIVLAVGAAYEITDAITLRAGWNYAENPVPSTSLTPLFPAIVGHHLTIGAGYKFNDHWSMDGAWEYAFRNDVTYSNPSFVTGANSVESHSQNSAHLFFSYKF